MALVRVQTADFSLDAELAAIAGGTAIGGVGCFVGLVRTLAAGRPLIAMTLEHYPAMTERALARIAAEAEARWSLLGCTVIHRVGRLAPGARIVLVLAAAAHRQAALEACGFLIDWLKTDAPFWKKEHFADGDDAWVAARAADTQATRRWSNPAGVDPVWTDQA